MPRHNFFVLKGPASNLGTFYIFSFQRLNNIWLTKDPATFKLRF